MSAEVLARIIAMSRWAADATATRVQPWRFGSAIFTDDFPGRYDSNFLRVERPIGSATPDELAADADTVQASLRHRELVFETRPTARAWRRVSGRSATSWTRRC